jgi:hypothetical protein
MAFQSIWYFSDLPEDVVDIIERDLSEKFEESMADSRLHGDALNKDKRNSQNAWIPTTHWVGGGGAGGARNSAGTPGTTNTGGGGAGYLHPSITLGTLSGASPDNVTAGNSPSPLRGTSGNPGTPGIFILRS